MMFTRRKECRHSIYHLDENGTERDQLFVGMEDLQRRKGITVFLLISIDVFIKSLYLPIKI